MFSDIGTTGIVIRDKRIWDTVSININLYVGTMSTFQWQGSKVEYSYTPAYKQPQA